MKLKNVDFLTILLGMFIVLFAILFFYLYQIDKSVKNYHENYEILAEMELLNNRFDDFAVVASELNNFSIINSEIERFSVLLSQFRVNVYKHYQNDSELFTKVSLIDKEFEAKSSDMEYFKSLNASLISGSHFLFDLQRNISESKKISGDAKSLVNETLFYLFQFTKSDYIEEAYVVGKLETLKESNKKENSVLLTNFYNQSKVLLHTFSEYRKTSQAIRKNELGTNISKLHTELESIYKHFLLEQQFIAMIFFVSTIFILLLFIILHFRALKNRRKLLAFNLAIEHSDNAIMITDPNRNIVFVNEAFEETTGYSADEVLGKNPRILKSDLQDESIYVEINQQLSKGESWQGEFINKRKDGTLFYERASIVPIMLNNKLINYLAIKLDITDYVEQNARLQQAASVFENTEEAIIIADALGNVLSVNKAFTHIYGYSLKDVKGKNLSLIHSGLQSESFYKKMWEDILQNDLFRGKLFNRTKSGEVIPVWVTIKTIRNKAGDIVNFTSVQTDLRAIENSEEKANYLAYHDPLTGLSNRTSLEEFVMQTLNLAKRNDKKFAILFIDLDRFKVINDTLGHDIGDKVLVSVTKRLKKILREGDFLARWGGDEFVVILHDIVSESFMAMVARKIINGLKETIHIGHHDFNITASIGISIYPENGDDANTLIKHADSAMYLAKEGGKNNFCFYTDELSAETEERLNIDIALHSALEKNEIYLVYQPQYSLKEKTIVSVEALVRWQHPTLGFIPPDKFIPIAEDNGVIMELGYFIFEEACKAFKQMKSSGVNLEKISINVSSIQFKHSDLLESFLSIVERLKIKPNEIEIEITERFLMENTVANIKTLQDFQDQGFAISIDDFGTGYSSMSYLKHLPINTIKIDKSFVDDINRNSSDNAVIEAIAALSKTLDYSIIAEGIETQEQEEFLENIGCDLGQGYLFSKPVSVDEIVQRYKN